MQSAYLGIDIGSTNCKVLLMSPDGKVMETKGTLPYPSSSFPQEGWSEQHPDDWVAVAVKAVRELVSATGVEILGIGLSGHMHGMVSLDENYQVLRPAILWNDQRCQKECQEITELAGGLEALLSMVNNPMLPGFTGGKIRWFQKHEPELFEKTRFIINPKDYVRFKLTGEIVTEVSDASGMGLFDVVNRRWSDELLSRIDIDPTLLPSYTESHEVSGCVSSQGAELFGIKAGIPVVGGGGDAVIQTLGAGVIDNTALQTTIGTGGIVATSLEQPIPNDGGAVQVFCHVIPKKWHCMGVTLNAGNALAWWKKTQGVMDLSFDDMATMAKSIATGAEGLLFLPYLMGERCPYADSSARGAFVGLRSHHTPSHFHRAVFEGITYSLRDIAGLIDQAQQSQVIHASGGGTNSSFWNQLQADILGEDVVVIGNASHGAAYGAALIAGLGLGNWSGVEDFAHLFQVEQRWSPQPAHTKHYDQIFQIYTQLYQSLKDVNDQLTTFVN